MAAVSLRDEATLLLRELIRLDTVNPPGNETLAAELLRDYLAESGVQAGLIARVPERANLVARLPGRGDGPTLLLLSHTDTVLADPAEWRRDPWSGDVVDGEIWGRGALDMKGQVAAAAVAIASLAREGFEPAGDLVYVAAADEEVGAGFGLSWLCREHPDAVRCDLCVNEGGGERIEVGGIPLYLCATAEKMSSPFRLRVRGTSGHASIGALADNALVKAARLIELLGEFRPEPRLIPEVAGLLRALGQEPPAPQELLDRARSLGGEVAELLEPLLGMTVAPTVIHASDKRNVIPALCDVVCDCRLLPEQTQAEAEAALRDALPEGDWELEWLEAQGGTRSPAEGPLWEAATSFVAETEPEARLAPVCCAGFTDSHWLREAFGAVSYGFFPARAMPAEEAAKLIHSADERIPVDDLELGVRWLRHAALEVLGRD
jgi:acetylornithine deacetylase/succinyl-diaminopimelate desuccinylase-like protein